MEILSAGRPRSFTPAATSPLGAWSEKRVSFWGSGDTTGKEGWDRPFEHGSPEEDSPKREILSVSHSSSQTL